MTSTTGLSPARAMVLASFLYASIAAASGLEDAWLLFAEGNYPEAIRAFKEANAATGGACSECLIGMARAYNRTGVGSKALECARLAVEKADTPQQEVEAHAQLGVSLLGQSRKKKQPLLREAESAFRKVVELSRGRINSAHYYLGEILILTGRSAEAAPSLQQYLSNEPDGELAASARLLIDKPHCASEPCIPELSLITTDGRQLTNRDFEGKVVLFDFWATWCAPCVAALPDIKQLSQVPEDSPFMLVGISVDHDVDTLAGVMANEGLDWPQYWDEEAKLTKEAFGIRRFPTYVLVDHRGVARYRTSRIDAGFKSKLWELIGVAKKARGEQNRGRR